MTPLEALLAGREVIADPKNWTQGWFARTKDGTPVYPDDMKAVCFCSVGAIGKVTPDNRPLRDRTIKILEEAAGPRMSVPRFNDKHAHAEVLGLWDKAIELARHK